MIRRCVLLLIVILLCAAGGTSQLRKQRKQISAKEQEELVQQMVRDRQLPSDCVQESGGAREVVSVELEDLNSDGRPEFFVMGKSGCAWGPRRPFAWYYRKTQKGYALMLYINQLENVVKRRTKTNGYYDLEVTTSDGADTFGSGIYKFDGTRYQEQKQRTRS